MVLRVNAAAKEARWVGAAALMLVLSLMLGLQGAAARADVLPGMVLQIGGPMPALAPAAEERPEAEGLTTADQAVGMGVSDVRFTVDVSSRAEFDDTTDELAWEQALGVDLLHVFSGPSGDLATLTAQLYLTRIDNQSRRSPAFDDDDDLELIYRILNLNVPVLDRGRMNVRVGHFELPYGLEHWVNTNGTLRTFTSEENLGLMIDWGVSVNGVVLSLIHISEPTRPY